MDCCLFTDGIDIEYHSFCMNLYIMAVLIINKLRAGHTEDDAPLGSTSESFALNHWE